MRNRFAAALRTLRGNSGSGIVLVLVCMLCVSMLGIMILYLSYTGVLLKITERQGQKDFYTASTAMDEIRAGVQKAASDSIGRAYKTVLVNYSNEDFQKDQADMTSKFRAEFRSEFSKWTASGNSLITINGGYSVDVLKSFLDSTQLRGNVGGTGVWVEAAGGANTATVEADGITLKNVKVSYTDAKGYTSSVTSDIVVNMPDFSYMISNYSISGLPSFAVVAKQEMTNAGSPADVTVTGSVYAGKISAVYKTLSTTGGTVVCPGTISAAGAGSVFSSSNATLWANRVEAGQKGGSYGSVVLGGTSYVRDDLELAGYQSSAALTGSYYGYGNSTTESDKSSAIIVNGRESSLSTSGLSTLMLAGHSFIQSVGTAADDVLMGESVSVRGNQMAYLIPTEYLVDSATGESPATNPIVHDNGIKPEVAINSAGKTELETKYGVKKTEINSPYPGSNQTVTYYFMQFTAAAGRTAEQNANAFFKDYFTNNTAKVQKYLSGYLNVYNSSPSSQSAGWTITHNGDKYALGSAPVSSTQFTSSVQLTDTFRRLCETLSAKDVAGTPYEYYVDSDMMAKASGTNYFRDADNKAVGVIVDNSKDNTKFVINGDGTKGDLNFVIASGDVEIDRPFTGLVISGGTVTVNSSVTADSTAVGNALAAKAETNIGGVVYTLSDFLKNGAANTTQNVGEADSGWNLGKLVTYKNWSKN